MDWQNDMELHAAIELIRGAFGEERKREVWADLGAGKGLFTRALANLLQEGSFIHAVDQGPQTIASPSNGSVIEFHQLDFTEQVLPFNNLHGIMMANSLHFVHDKKRFVSHLKPLLHRNGRVIIVEYELNHGNEWVPYPIPFLLLKKLLSEEGFMHVEKIGQRKSVYGSHQIYAANAILG
jgi:ubiquinone/menaquinone biosynthesis C-methylase UbiE